MAILAIAPATVNATEIRGLERMSQTPSADLRHRQLSGIRTKIAPTDY